MSAAASVLALTAKEERGEQLSPEEGRIVDEYWAGFAQPLTPEFRARLIATTKAALAERRRKIDGWRWVLFVLHWWLSGTEPTWHDYYSCETCGHRWPDVPWVGPYELGDDSELT